MRNTSFPPFSFLLIWPHLPKKTGMKNSPDGIALFSGGLDSILAAKVLEDQGLDILCVHFTSPFFGSSAKAAHWRHIHNLNIMTVDAGPEFAAMLASGPVHGFGHILNPCVDCKILLLKLAKSLMQKFGASFLATGEVTGQRPMSQRRDSMDTIQNCAGVKGLLLRPLCALHQEPTEAEKSGLVDRSRLLGISGRGRIEQLALAEKYRLSEIPSPAGGCVLTEKENGRRYWQIIKRWRQKPDSAENLARDFRMAREGRQFWRNGPDCEWLRIGRNASDNRILLESALPDDITLKLRDFSGPLALARDGGTWPREVLNSAAALLAAHSSRATASSGPVAVSCRGAKDFTLTVLPDRQEELWNVPEWETVRPEISEYNKQAQERRAIAKRSRS